MKAENLLVLTDEQLVTMAKEGSETAEEILIEKYKGLVKAKAKAYFIVGQDEDDVIQEGMIGLFKSIRAFNPNRDASFKTFASTCINNQIFSAMKKAERNKAKILNDSIPMDAELEETLAASKSMEPEIQLLHKETYENLASNNEKIFSKMELKVLSEKMKGLDYKEIAEVLGKTPKSIDNTLQRIKKKIITYLDK